MKNFLNSGKLFAGINYWASDTAINMWTNWNEKTIEDDFKKISEAGLTHLRVFPIWSVFQPLNAIYDNFGVIEYRLGEELLPPTEAGRAGVDETACEKFQIMCDIAKKYGLKLVVGLLTGHMSGRYYAPPAFQGKNPLSDPTLIKWEIRFIKYFVKRFKNEHAIAGWDLGNECCGFASREDTGHPDMTYVWQSAIANTIRLQDHDHPVISGYDFVPIAKDHFNALELGEAVDIHTVHPYNIFHTTQDPLISMRPILDSAYKCRLYSDLGKVPTFIQEIGAIGYTNCSEKTEADFYRALMFSAWAHDCFGVMWWCAFDQGHLEYAPYDLNNIGSDYGFFRRDGSSKPIAEENKKIINIINSLPFDKLPPAITDAVCIVPKTKGCELLDLMRTTYCLAKQANFDVNFAYADDEIPKSDLYILPSLDDNKSISLHKLNEGLERVKEGASLYISIGSALFRRLPELSGISIAYREGNSSLENVYINNTILKMKPDFKFAVESCNAEIIAEGNDKRPVYVKNRYGDGYIYFSTIPIEKYLTGQNEVFNNENTTKYSLWYDVLKNEKTNKKVVKIDSNMIRSTEHICDENTRYVVFINYSKEPLCANIELETGWKTDVVFYGCAENGFVRIPQCDAVIMKIKKTIDNK